VNPENGKTVNISNNPDVAWTYTTVGKRITCISDKDICKRCEFLYQMDVDGKNDHKITNFRLRDSWMGFRKNGTEIIFSPHESVYSVFYIIDLIGQVLKKVNTGLPYAVDPTFSPDGQKNWKLTDNPQSEVYHNWSPDGKWLVMDLSDTAETKYQIGLMNWKTKQLNVLTDTLYDYQQSPVFIAAPY
jgi:Tol biopolymer transport system component